MSISEYLEGFQNDISLYENCSSTIQNGVAALQQKLTLTGYNQVAKDFK